MIRKAQSIIKDYFNDERVHLYHCCLSAGVLMVIIDSDEGVKLSDCSYYASKINTLLSIENIDIELEVASPGIDRRLYIKEHYIVSIGQSIVCKLRQSVMDLKELCGILLQVNDESFIIKEVKSNLECEILFSNVRKVNIDA